MKTPLKSKDGMLFIEDFKVSDLLLNSDTPLYVLSESRIRDNAKRLLNAFQKRCEKFKIYYAIKANNNLSVLNILRSEGFGADCSCPEEIELAKLAGFAIEDMLYTGNYHSDSQLKYAYDSGVIINFDDVSQLDRLSKLSMPEKISFRINPGIGKGGFKGLALGGKDSKFGIDEKTALKAYKKAKKYGAKKFGIHMMTGSAILDYTYFKKVTEKLMDTIDKISKKVEIEFDFIDVGGGLGIPYKPEEKSLYIDKAVEGIVEAYKNGLTDNIGSPYLVMEPGRYIVGDAGVLLTQVHSIKKTKDKKYVGVDAGMHNLLRPALYDAYHHIYVDRKLNAKEKDKEKVTVVGQICENTDQLAKDRVLPKLEEGDVLAICDVGAYGFSMSSQYNSKPRPAEVLIYGSEANVIREKETLNNLIKGQHVPDRLKIR